MLPYGVIKNVFFVFERATEWFWQARGEWITYAYSKRQWSMVNYNIFRCRGVLFKIALATPKREIVNGWLTRVFKMGHGWNAIREQAY